MPLPNLDLLPRFLTHSRLIFDILIQHLKPNMSKAELMIFPPKTCSTCSLSSQLMNIPSFQRVKNLGVILSSSLSHTTVQSFQILMTPPSKYYQTLSPHSLISHPCVHYSHLIRATIIIIILPAHWGSFPAALPASSLNSFSRC